MARGRSNVSSANVDADLAAFNDELDGLGNEALPLLHDSGSSGLPPSNEPTTSGSSLPTGQARTASSAGLEERANLIKRHCTLSAEAEGKLDLLVESCPGLETSSLFLCGYVLQAVDLLSAQRRDYLANWKLPSITEQNCTNVARAFVLSGHVASYRSNSIEIAYRFMSDKGLCPLPSPFDTAQIGIVKACLSSSFTRFRCDFKKKVTLSLQPGSDLENVGTLALALLGESESQFTISFAWRLALVRGFGGVARAEKVFWPALDSHLAVLHSKPEHVVLAFVSSVKCS